MHVKGFAERFWEGVDGLGWPAMSRGLKESICFGFCIRYYFYRKLFMCLPYKFIPLGTSSLHVGACTDG